MSRRDSEQCIKAGTLIAVYRKTGKRFVPVSVSARHLHLSRADVDALLGTNYELTPVKELVQPGQFASSDTVALEGPKGRIEGIRVLGPIRPNTQVEISMTDALKLGIRPEIRMSGDIIGSPGGSLVSDRGRIDIPGGVIIAARHLHISAEQADAFGLRNGDVVRLKKAGPREVIFGGFIVRSGLAHELEAHVDTDEANAAAIADGDLLEII